MGPLLLLLIQAATPASAKPVRPTPPQSMSILVDPCASATDDNGRDVVVCGRPDAISPRLPLRNDRGPPDHPVPSNPDGTGIGALAATDAVRDPWLLHRLRPAAGRAGVHRHRQGAQGPEGLARPPSRRHPPRHDRPRRAALTDSGGGGQALAPPGDARP